MKIAITAGYNKSKHAIALIHQLHHSGITLESCLIVKTFSIKRFRYYYKQLDKKELIKKLKDRIFNKYVADSKLSDEIKYINDYLKKHNIQHSSVTDACKALGIKSAIVNNLNEPKCINNLNEVDLIVYAGGGILREAIIKKPTIGILNCHSSRLPEVRGMNATEWSILKGIPTANTMHFISRKVDQGPIIKILDRDYSHCNSINQIRGQAITYSIEDLTSTIKDLMSGNYSTTDQNEADGKQYFTMHPILKEIVNQKLAK